MHSLYNLIQLCGLDASNAEHPSYKKKNVTLGRDNLISIF
jgi:hypothetical protein